MKTDAIQSAVVMGSDSIEGDGAAHAQKIDKSATSSVEPWQGQSEQRETAQAAGGMTPRNLQRLDGRAVTEQVDQLMKGGALDFWVSEDECRAAVGLLNSLPPAEYAKAIDALSRSGSLKLLCEKAPAELRAELAESVVRGGLSTETRERFSAGLRNPQPPPQPKLITNSPSLPPELRGLIHAENAARGATYKADFARYVDAYCAKVKSCRTPMELRGLGPISTPPRLLEPGISSDDFKAKRFISDLAPTNMGSEQAARAVSQRIDAFRGGLGAGQMAFAAEAKAQLKRTVGVAGDVESNVGIAREAKGVITGDGRVVEAGVEPEVSVDIGVEHVAKVELKYNDEHLEKVAVEVLGSGIELARDGEITLKGGVGGGVAVEVAVNPREAKMGAMLVGEEEAELGPFKGVVEGKVGFVAKGASREYYPDIGGSQQGFFGPMPELDAKANWRAMPEERRAWYTRQGFDEQSWPH